MSKFLDFLKEELQGGLDEPGVSDNANSGNVSHKSPIISNVPEKIEDKEKKSFQEFIDKNEIEIPEDEVANAIALVEKSLEDWNREKKFDGQEILRIIKLAIENNIIDVKSY
jgi:hypothetical protein